MLGWNKMSNHLLENNEKFYYFKNNQICSIKPFDIYSSNGELLKKKF
jgi:hypothetical protein